MTNLNHIQNWEEMMNKIIQGDCLEGMRIIPDNVIDLIVTDPPYCVGTTSNGRKGTWEDNNLIKPFFDILFSEYFRILKDGSEFYINTDWRTYPFLYPILVQIFKVRNLIVWDYEWIKAGSHFRFSHEFIIYGTKGDSKRKFSASERDVWRIPPINFSKEKNHNAEKPLELIEKIILLSSKEGDIILDSFMGSWTTARAAKNLKRNFIGFEINTKYCQVGEERLDQNVLL